MNTTTILTQGDGEAAPVGQLILEVLLPGSKACAVAAAAVSKNEETLSPRILRSTIFEPPGSDAVDGEFRRVRRLSDDQNAEVPLKIVDPIG